MLPGAWQDLRADCGRCAALCCVAPAFTVSADFAVSKPAGRPCPHLLGDFRCGIHAGLRDRGFPGQADVLARHRRLRGQQVRFLTAPTTTRSRT